MWKYSAKVYKKYKSGTKNFHGSPHPFCFITILWERLLLCLVSDTSLSVINVSFSIFTHCHCWLASGRTTSITSDLTGFNTVSLRLIKGNSHNCSSYTVCVCVYVCYHCKQHGQHFLVDEILWEVNEDVSIVCLQSCAIHRRHIRTKC